MAEVDLINIPTYRLQLYQSNFVESMNDFYI